MWLGQLDPPVICHLDQRMDKNMAKDSCWQQFVATQLASLSAVAPLASPVRRPHRLRLPASGRRASLSPAAAPPHRRPRLLPVAGRVARPTVAGHVARVNALSIEGFAENDSGESQQ
jgi:hypothetical protein